MLHRSKRCPCCLAFASALHFKTPSEPGQLQGEKLNEPQGNEVGRGGFTAGSTAA